MGSDLDLVRFYADPVGGGPERAILIDPRDERMAQARDTEFVGHTGPPRAWVVTFDHIEQKRIEIAVAPCGLRCRCGLAWRPFDAAGAASSAEGSREVVGVS